MELEMSKPNRDVNVRFANAELVEEIMRRVVSAASVQASLTVDQLTNAITSLETLIAGIEAVLPDDAPRSFRVSIADRRVDVAIVELKGDQPNLIRLASEIEGVGDLLAATATKVFEFRDGNHSALAVSIA